MNPSDPRMRGFEHRADVADVLALLEERIVPLPPESIATQDAASRVVVESVTSPVDLPGFDRSAMDGYALRGEDTFGATDYAPLRFEIIGSALPGEPFDGSIGKDQAVRITTGAPIPDGADAVLMVESTAAGDDPTSMNARAAVTPGKNISRRGEDVEAGVELVAAGRRLRPQDIAVCVAAGVAGLSVHRRPRVDVVVNGNELLSPGLEPREALVVDSNGPMLAALVERDAGTPVLFPPVPDHIETLEQVVEGSSGDVMLIAGGSSVGPEDHVPQVIAKLGELVVHGIAMRPSSPAGIGFVGDRPIFLLPGNPVSCLCAYDFFAGPSIRALGGLSRDWPYRTTTLPLARKLSSAAGRVDYARVRVVDGGVEPLMVSGASILSSATRADGVVIVPRDDEGIEAGTEVTVHLYG